MLALQYKAEKHARPGTTRNRTTTRPSQAARPDRDRQARPEQTRPGQRQLERLVKPKRAILVWGNTRTLFEIAKRSK